MEPSMKKYSSPQHSQIFGSKHRPHLFFNRKWELDGPIFLQRKDLNVLWLTILNPPPALYVLGSNSDTGLPAQDDLL